MSQFKPEVLTLRPQVAAESGLADAVRAINNLAAAQVRKDTSSLIDLKGLKVLRPNKRVKFTKATLSHVKHSRRKKSIAGENFIVSIFVSVVHTHQNSRIDLRKKQRETRAMRSRTWVETFQKYSQVQKRKTKLHSIRLTRSG